MSVSGSESGSESDYDENEVEKINPVQNEKVQEFVGFIANKQGWNKCMYCDRYHPPSMHLPGIEYCGHCWAWLNSNQLNLEKCTYNGPINITDIKKYLGLTFKLHDPNKCTNKECIYNKINTFEKANKLHKDFCVELGFKVEPETTSASVPETNTQKAQFKLNKKSNMRINYKQSYVTI